MIPVLSVANRCQAKYNLPAMSLNIVFMGSPEFSLPVLRQLTQSYNVVGVVTQPDVVDVRRSSWA